MEGLWGAGVPWRGGCRLCAWENRAACASCAKRDMSPLPLACWRVVALWAAAAPHVLGWWKGKSWRAPGAEVRAVGSGRVGAGVDN